MQSTESVENCLKGTNQEQPRRVDWQIAFASVKDPRRKQGQRYSIVSILLLALAAILSNHVSELAIAQWGATQSEEVKKAVGFEKGVTPHQTTIQRLFRRVSAEEVEAAFRSIFLQIFDQDKQERGTCAVSIDGKAQRGRLKFEQAEAYPIHAVSIVEHQTGIVLTRSGMLSRQTAKRRTRLLITNRRRNRKASPTQASRKRTKRKRSRKTRKRRAILSVAFRLLSHIDWKGKVVTGDALYCQRCLCRAICLAKGDYLFLVKANQPQLFEDIRLLFAPPEPAKRAGEGILRLPEQHGSTAETGHGRMDIRRIRVSSELKGYSDWPGLEQVFEIRRGYQSKGEWRESIRYGVTSLPATIAIPEHVLKLKRGHWGIESLHYVKDVTLGEDRSTIHKDNGPKIMAALRNSVVSLLRRAGCAYDCGSHAP